MRITAWARAVLALVGLGFSLQATPARAEIIGTLELPSVYASGISNVQGWVYTTTPGAELIQPFAVLIDSVEKFKVPCCGDRGDVQETHPGAPLLTGFSGVYNWGLTWVEQNSVIVADSPQGGSPSGADVLVQVVVTDTMGGFAIFGQTVQLFNPTPWPRSKMAEWKDSLDPDPVLPLGTDTGQGILPAIESTCDLSNNGLYSTTASLKCSNMKYTAPDDSTFFCVESYFDWDKASQSFKLTSNCDFFK
ncbi:MAG: hypothetical protein P8R42_24030 [Candidatus Binatia bacterium]|nr:hypothetical protein [Candidatus Binatia bacterium]